jgi:PKD repeat protein
MCFSLLLRRASLLFAYGIFSLVVLVIACQAQPAPNQPPTCTLSVSPSTGYVPLNVFARGSCSDPQNSISSTTLDFGDGTVLQNTTNANHTYTQKGTFTVTLTATDSAGLSGSASQTVTVKAVPPPQNGDVYVPYGNTIGRFDRTGSQEQALSSNSQVFGLVFDSSNNLYGAERSVEVEKFDANGNSLGSFGSGFTDPDSLVFDAFGNLYVADASSGHIVKLNSSGTPLATYSVAVDSSGNALWIDLAPDECTAYYTSGGTTIKRFDLCQSTQLSDFATLPASPAEGLHIRPNGEVLVADTTQLLRLNSAGSVIQSYADANDVCNVNSVQWIDLSLDPDGTSFWATERCSDTVYHFDISSGSILTKFQISNCDCTISGGIVVRGEITAAADPPPTCTLQVNPNQGPAPFTTTATGSCTDAENDITNTSLNWGDGTVVNGATSGTHTYSSAGSYTVTVTATNRVGLMGSASQPVTVINGSIQCSLSIDSPSGAAPHTINATGTCTANDPLQSMTIAWGDNTPAATQTNFGGTDQGTFTPPPHTYSNPGTYAVTLTGQNSSGQTATDTKTVTVFDSTPQCTLSPSNSSGLAPFSVTFSGSCTDAGNDISSGNSSATLNFGDNTPAQQISTANGGNFSNVSHLYQNPGTYTAVYTVTDNSGHTGTARSVVTVSANQPPTCTLTLDKNSGTAPLTINANASCTDPEDGVVSASINWGDGSPSQSLSCDGSCSFSGPHTYTAPGSYTVVVTGTDAGGLSGSANQTVTVAAPVDSTPKCSVNSNSQNGAAPFTVTFSGSCQDAGNDLGQGSSGSLDFGDGTPAQQVSPASFSNVSHVYQAFGTYTATFTATDSTQHTGTSSLTITVTTPVDSTPMCTLSSDKQTGQAPLTVNFTGSCNDAGNDLVPSSQSFNFGDGSAAQNGTTASHTYAQPGTYHATFSASDSHGNTGSTSETITATANQPPTCTLTLDKNSGAAPLTVNATATCSDPDNESVNTASLDWGDGSTPQSLNCDGSCSFSGPHTYTTASTYNAVVTGTDAGGLSGSANQTVTVTQPVNSTPNCSLNSNSQNGAAPFTVTFSGSCQDAGNDLGQGSTGTLNFGDNTPAQQVSPATFSNVSHVYQAPGTYTAAFAATDSTQHTGTSSLTVTVTTPANSTPMCTLNSDKQTGQAPLTVNFTGSCTDAGNDLIATSQSFNFGDGSTTQNGTSASHTYAQPGTYQATFSASDSNGNSGSTSLTITVTAAPPPPNLPPTCTLTVAPSSGQVPLTVTATGRCTAGSSPIVGTTLDFGDGTTLSSGSGTHTYTQAGIFTVKITATDSLGLSGSATQNVTATASKFPQGVFVGIHGGTVMQFSPDGTVLQTLSTGAGGTVAGMAFDSAGIVYTVNFTAGSISKLDLKAGALVGPFGSGYNCQPESMVFDGAGNAYVGEQGCSRATLKFDPSGKLLATYQVGTEEQGGDDVDLSADQCTLLYTSEGPSILRYDVCRNRQLTPFATGLNKTLNLRILADGGVIVADLFDVVHLNSSGQPVMTYSVPGEQCLYGVALDQDGTSFWSSDYCSSNIYRFDIASGKQLSKFNTGTPSGTVFGLAIAGAGLNVAGLGNGGAMTASPSSANLAPGQSATFTISFTPNAAAAGHTLALSCASLPPGLSCSFTPQTIALGAAGTTTTANLTITRTIVAALRQSSTWMLATSLGCVPAMVLVGLRSPRRRRGSLMWLGLIVASTGIWASCGGGGMSNSTTPQPTPQGTYTVIVVGTTQGAQASTTVNLTVQ